MEENQTRKVIIMSLAGLLIGSLLFIFGISMQESNLPLIVNYIIAILLYLSSFLAVYNHYKKQKEAIFIYIMFLSLLFIIIVSIALTTHLLS